jgi:hypothetical protein
MLVSSTAIISSGAGFNVIGEVSGCQREWTFSHEQPTEEIWLKSLKRVTNSEESTTQEVQQAQAEADQAALKAKTVEGVLSMKVRGLVDKWLPKHCAYHPPNKIFGCNGASIKLSHFTVPPQTLKSRPYRFNISGECLGEHRTYELAAPDNESYANWCTSVSGRELPAIAKPKTFLERLLPMEEVTRRMHAPSRATAVPSEHSSVPSCLHILARQHLHGNRWLPLFLLYVF